MDNNYLHLNHIKMLNFKNLHIRRLHARKSMTHYNFFFALTKQLISSWYIQTRMKKLK